MSRLRESGRLRFLREETLDGERVKAELATGSPLVLLDDKTMLPTPAVRFPLRARHLAPALLGAVTRRTYASLAEWIEATPDYFGGSRFA